MTIWRGTSAVPTLGPEIHIKYKVFGSGSGKYNAEAERAVGLARQIMNATTTMMNGGWAGMSAMQQRYMKYYFVTGQAAPNATVLDVIKQTYILIRNGLYGNDLNLKVTVNGDANGYVNSHANKKSRHTTGVRGGNTVHRGDIHLDTNRLEGSPELAAKTTIHEAAHKFASCADFGEKGYTSDTTFAFRAPGLTNAQAINNAESYAMCAMLCFMYPDGT